MVCRSAQTYLQSLNVLIFLLDDPEFVDIYSFKHRRKIGGVVVLWVNEEEPLLQFTLCLWFYPFGNNTEATVINYGEGNNLKIYFNGSNFIINMLELKWYMYKY